MATLSIKLNLVEGIWQEVGSYSIDAQKDPSSTIELVNADALPVGDVPEAMIYAQTTQIRLQAPASGSLYVRVRYGTGSLKFYEV
ncbi:MAG: hypothetical protein DRG30_05445 [Epsilonproteobacteria bacterium]|nr:MAG: hypothetical protein DRG30_05445 [Campylobacterota bacterium]